MKNSGAMESEMGGGQGSDYNQGVVMMMGSQSQTRLSDGTELNSHSTYVSRCSINFQVL